MHYDFSPLYPLLLWTSLDNAGWRLADCGSLIEVCTGVPHHNAIVNEATAVAGRAEVGVLLSAGHLDAPHRFPGFIELCVDGVHAGVVGGHSIPQIRGNPMFLGMGHRLSPGPGEVWGVEGKGGGDASTERK